MASYIFGGSTGETPESVRQKRQLADMMTGRTQGAKNWGEGFNAMMNGLVSRWTRDEADAAQQAGISSATTQYEDYIRRALTGDTSAMPPAQDIGLGPGASPDMAAYRDAIAGIESAGSGDYGAIGPTHDTLGRALGRYQVMEANLAPWSQEALGRAVTPDEFLANPALQDAVFDHRFGQYVNQFGPEGAAQAWFAGPGGVGQMDRRDSLGTSVGDYTDKFRSAAGGGGGPSPQAAQAGGPDLNELLMLSANPWLNEGQRGAVNALIEQQMRAQDPGHQLDLQTKRQGLERGALELDAMRNPAAPKPVFEGGQWWDIAGGQPNALTERAVDPTPQIRNLESLVERGIDPNEALDRAFSGGVSVNVGTGDDKFFGAVDGAEGKVFADLLAEGPNTGRKRVQIDQLEGLLNNMTTGGPAVFQQMLGEFGINSEGLDSIQAAQALINQIVPEQRQPGSGPMSDADLALFKQSVPRIINTPGGNQMIIDTMRGINDYTMAQSDIASRLAGRQITREQARAELANLPNPLAGYGKRVGAQEGGVAKPMNDGDYQALPSGTLFIDPDDGKTYRKP